MIMAKEKLITITQLKKELKDLPADDLIRLIIDIAQTSPLAKEFLTVRFAGKKEANEIFEKYKERVEYEFFPPNGFGRLNLREAKKAVTDFKKICQDENMGLDIMLFYVENCIEFTDTYGDINETFYNSAASVYNNIVKEINSADKSLYNKFANRIEAAVANACDGWGFRDEMTDIYNNIIWLKERESDKNA